MRPDLVLHVGQGVSGPLLTSSLPLLERELAQRGVRVCGVGGPSQVGGAPVLAVGTGTIPVPRDPDDAWALCELTAGGVERVLAASGARRARVVFCPERQDRLMERTYRAAVRAGFDGALADLFPRMAHPLLDYSPLVADLLAVPGVIDLRVVPVELADAEPAALVLEVLASLEPERPLPAAALRGWKVPPDLDARGVRIAAAMAAHLDTDAERQQVDEFVLANFSSASAVPPSLLSEDERTSVLDAYAGCNERFLADHAPAYPAKLYCAAGDLALLVSEPVAHRSWTVRSRSPFRRA